MGLLNHPFPEDEVVTFLFMCLMLTPFLHPSVGVSRHIQRVESAMYGCFHIVCTITLNIAILNNISICVFVYLCVIESVQLVHKCLAVKLFFPD